MKTCLNQNLSKAALLMIAALFSFETYAQLNYNFTATTGTYTANSGGTAIVNASTDDALSSAQSIGFNFTYGCTTYTKFIASSNGWLSLGAVANQVMYADNLATTDQGPIIAPLWDDLATSSTGNVNFVLSGTAPNRVLTVEWLNMKWDYNTSSDVISFQVKLYETTNIIELIYKAGSVTPNSPSASIGISGGSGATDFYSLNGTGTAPSAVYGTQSNTLAARPATNQLYRFTPGNQVFTSCTASQVSTATISKCEPNQTIIAVQVVASGCISPLNVTQIKFNMNGSSIPGGNTNDVSKIHIYYSGNIPAMSASNEFVSGGITPATGTITANGSQSLVNGTNYFWITYDINTSSATTGNLLDAQCSQITVAGVNQTPTITDPAGTGTIGACSVAPGSTKSNLAFWLKANAGTSSTTDATALSAWSDQSGNGRTASSAAAATSPVYYDNSTNNINFNPVVNFDAASQNTAAADFMDISSGGILSSGNNPYSVYAVIKPASGNTSSPGKFLFSGVFDPAGNTFNSFDIRAGGSFNDSWDLNDLIVPGQWAANNAGMATFDFNSVNREIFVAGTSAGTKAGNSRNSPDQYNALGCQRAVTPNKEFFDGSIAEIISYTNTSHNATTRSKIESYLAIKYGITLGHNYLSSVGGTVWDRTINTAYNNNIVGIAQDNNSALNQKQSKSTSVVPDILTLYIGPAKLVNQVNNTGTFTAGDRSFFIAANNGDPYFDTGTPEEVPPGVCCRLKREWLSQKTNFTNTDLKLEFDFNVIAPGYAPLNVSDLRLLVDDDGNFTNALVLGSPAVNITVVSGVVTVTVPAANFTNTPYFTLGSVSYETPLPVQFVRLTAACHDNIAQLNWITTSEGNNDHYTVQRSADGKNFVDISVVNTKSTGEAEQSYSFADASPLAGVSYYRIKATDKSNAITYSSVITFTGCGANIVRLITNPGNGESELLLQLSKNSQVEISFFDVAGRSFSVPGLTGRQSKAQGTYRIPVTNSNLKAGIYLLTVTINNSRTVYRVIKD